MTPRTVAKRYARALLALAAAEGDPIALGDAIGQVATVLAEPSVAAVVGNPTIGLEGRQAVVRGVVESLGLLPMLRNCLFLLAERQRLDILDELWRAYTDLLDRSLGRSRVAVRAAVPLRAHDVEQILTVIRRLVGKENLIPVLEVDPDLLGGIVCEAEGVVYDGSVEAHVNRLARQMLKETVHG